MREATAQILGGMLKMTYTIDPAVHGTVTLHTARPLSRGQLLPALQSLLAGVGATLVQADGVARVVPVAAAGAAGSTVLPLRYASAEELVKVLQPLAGASAHLAAEPWRNAVVIAAAPGQVEPLVELVRSFDVDELAGQSYAVLPVTSGNAREFAEALRAALRGRRGDRAGAGGAAGALRRGAGGRAAAPLSSRRRRASTRWSSSERRRTVRSWHVYYLQNSHGRRHRLHAADGLHPEQRDGAADRADQCGARAACGGSAMLSGGGGSGGGCRRRRHGRRRAWRRRARAAAWAAVAAAAAWARRQFRFRRPGGGRHRAGCRGGGADHRRRRAGRGQPATRCWAGSTRAPAADNPDAMRILPNPQNNAVLIYATAQEEDDRGGDAAQDRHPAAAGAHRRHHRRGDAERPAAIRHAVLLQGRRHQRHAQPPSSTTTVAGTLASTALSTSFPGFVLGGSQVAGGPLAISALQAVTTVTVLSSPQIMVVDNQPARLQVGSLVPYLQSQQQSTLSSANIVNSVGYQPTGVILEVTPRVNSGGLVTLDISQEVSQVDASAPTTSNISSPQFLERSVTSRVVVQDGQTIGLAGLISDNVSRGNQGIPWLKDIPLLGVLAGQQNNVRARTELLVLITPHVIHDQRDARALTEDMREALHSAATAPAALHGLAPTGSDDPDAPLRARVRRWVDP